MHCAHLVVDGRKMSKSLGNFYTLRDLIKKGYSSREIRYVLLSAQYRQSLNFTFAALDAARASIQRLDEFGARLASIAGQENAAGVSAAGMKNTEWVAKFMEKFRVAMDEDLNVPIALSALYDLVHEGNRRMAAGSLPPVQALSVLETLTAIDSVLGILKHAEDKPDAAVMALAQARQDARKAKNWAEADRLRKEIEAKGWLVQDAADGFKLKRHI